MRKHDVLDITRGRSLAASGQARSIRKQAKVSQSEVASAIGVTASALSHYEAGRRVPTGKVAIRLCHVLDELREQVRTP
jgi:transcriptional regulator with XRE-family HTH domain